MSAILYPLSVASRIAAAILGGYIFTWGFAVSSTSGLVAMGVAYDQARTGTMLFAFLIFLGAFLWSFATASIARVWLVLAGGGALMTAVAWYVQRSVVG
jgi:hypothetical protein